MSDLIKLLKFDKKQYARGSISAKFKLKKNKNKFKLNNRISFYI